LRWNHIETVGDDRPSALMHTVDPCEEFIYDPTDKISTTFNPHNLVAWHQSPVLTQCRKSLNELESIVIVDFVKKTTLS
jgi:hypothetical protein